MQVEIGVMLEMCALMKRHGIKQLRVNWRKDTPPRIECIGKD